MKKSNMDQEELRRSIGKWRCATMVLTIMCLASIITVVFIVVKHETIRENATQDCGTRPFKIDLSEPDNPGIFHDLTKSELKAIRKYLFLLPKLNLVRISEVSSKASYIFAIDLFVPPKEDSLKFLDKKGEKPSRQAKVVIFRGDKSPPVVEEYIVGPLPKPTSCALLVSSARKNPMPFYLSPLNVFEFSGWIPDLFSEIDVKVGHILKESYDTTFINCGKKCLGWFPSPLSPAILKKPQRKMWLRAVHNVEYSSLHPLDFLLLADIDGNASSNYFIEKIIYAGAEFSSLDDLSRRYKANLINKSRIPFPSTGPNLFSTLNRRGDPVPELPQRPPRLIEPDGKRYSIYHKHVEYMQWAFDFRMSTLLGPQVYDIRFNGDRIVYELGVQEIAVFYSGDSPVLRITDVFDSAASLGSCSKPLIPGADCPETATFISQSFLLNKNDHPTNHHNIFCVFEQNSGYPLRRHMSYSIKDGSFYSGMLDSALHLRTILVVSNYDYIIDYIFHQNGALEVQVRSTGYIASTFYTPAEDKYGFQLHDNVIGNIHHHLFNFKVDLDVLGTKNRYETLDISTEEVQNEVSTGDPTATYWQIKYDRKLKETEQEAAYKFNFDSPKYHIFHNNEEKTAHGVPRAYRVQLKGMSKQLLPENLGNENSASWSRYQMAVTKHKDDERESSSYFAIFDGLDPAVNFTNFLADNENIVDEDLVVWISEGFVHIPHTEDLPVTATSGCHLGFFLLPYNYFEECPSMASRDAVRLELKNEEKPDEGVRVVRYGNPGKTHCIVTSTDLVKEAGENPDAFLQSKGVD